MTTNSAALTLMTMPSMNSGFEPFQAEFSNHEDDRQVSYLVLDADGTTHCMRNADIARNEDAAPHTPILQTLYPSFILEINSPKFQMAFWLMSPLAF